LRGTCGVLIRGVRSYRLKGFHHEGHEGARRKIFQRRGPLRFDQSWSG
jgi:hypothetical protein